MNMSKWREAIAATFLAVMTEVMGWIAVGWEFLTDSSPWPKRYMQLREPDGTIVNALILNHEENAYTIEIRRSKPSILTFWLYDAEMKVVFHDDINILNIDPPHRWCWEPVR